MDAETRVLIGPHEREGTYEEYIRSKVPDDHARPKRPRDQERVLDPIPAGLTGCIKVRQLRMATEKRAWPWTLAMLPYGGAPPREREAQDMPIVRLQGTFRDKVAECVQAG